MYEFFFTDEIIQLNKEDRFKKSSTSREIDFLEYRCFPRERFNARVLLKLVGLDCYDPFQIVKITHGAMVDDVFWIRFEGEDLTWNDVNPRAHLDRRLL